MILAAGAAIPGGLFMPSIMVGASFGAFYGQVLIYLFKNHSYLNIQPGLYAVVGATAMLGGVFRSSISLVIIVLEGTGAIDYLFAIIIAVMVSNWVASLVHTEGRYESDLETDHSLPFLSNEAGRKLLGLTASDVMSAPVIGFTEVEPVANLIATLRNCRHNGFPVYGSDGQRVAGFILRKQVMVGYRA